MGILIFDARSLFLSCVNMAGFSPSVRHRKRVNSITKYYFSYHSLFIIKRFCDIYTKTRVCTLIACTVERTRDIIINGRDSEKVVKNPRKMRHTLRPPQRHENKSDKIEVFSQYLSCFDMSTPVCCGLLCVCLWFRIVLVLL